jgi:predicted membrane channel-forming protein YqfA (hemolysin III family)
LCLGPRIAVQIIWCSFPHTIRQENEVAGGVMQNHNSLPLLALRPIDLCSSSLSKKLTVRSKRVELARTIVPIGKHFCPDIDHYEIQNPRQAYWRVLFSHKTSGDRSQSIVGQTGHLERANAWTHLIAAAAFAIYSLVRPWVLDMQSLTAQLSGVAVVMSAFMFATSVTYHVYSTVRGCNPIMRNLDHLAIYLAMAVSATADLSLVTRNFTNVSFQTIVDPLLAATVIGVYFTVRRLIIPNHETRNMMFKDACSLGLFRFFHSDLEHASLRVVSVGILTLVWVPMVPPAFSNLTVAAAGVWMAGVLVASALLVSGVLFDNLYGPDKAMANGEMSWTACTCCQSKRLGCVFTSHAWWHVISVAGAVLAVVAREFGVSQIF